ncbi:hypothetical protein HELRODRAFT_183441 [Helobdella robusta]|uniref:Uncharacterized protein n=1 Tax=Helobdella robusta TaxID=6412 RepID=T1FJN7_HELRO|nr:hypothetical protein HELRODRAFT_183441 [Helobdella robusta]ESO11200.1 hypothetical protein HELRODRAFT_183441 [Helobdella robusta]
MTFSQFDGSIVFPDITICNLDPFAAGEPEEMSMNEYFSKVDEVKNNFIQELRDRVDKNHYFNFEFFTKIFKKMKTVSGFIINLQKNYQNSTDCPSFIVDCSFFGANWLELGKNCSIDNFSKTWNQNYLTCYTLKTSSLQFSSSNLVREMSLLLNVGPIRNTKMTYQSSLLNSQSRGVKVSVHSPGTPADLKRGFNVAPGTENIVEITQTERRRLNKPHNKENCLHKFICRNNQCKSHLLYLLDSELEKLPYCGNFSSFFNMPANDSNMFDTLFSKLCGLFVKEYGIFL